MHGAHRGHIRVIRALPGECGSHRAIVRKGIATHSRRGCTAAPSISRYTDDRKRNGPRRPERRDPRCAVSRGAASDRDSEPATEFLRKAEDRSDPGGAADLPSPVSPRPEASLAGVHAVSQPVGPSVSGKTGRLCYGGIQACVVAPWR